METEIQVDRNAIETMFKAGVQYGYVKRRRHPSVIPFIFGAKDKVEIFDLEKTFVALEKAKTFIKDLAQKNKIILFVSGKPEGKDAIKKSALSIQMPFVAGRWKGGTLTNFEEIKKRVKKLEDLTAKRDAGELAKYTKKERLMIDREIISLEEGFSGLMAMPRIPDALFIVDAGQESIALAEANQLGIPVISLSSSDCDYTKVAFPIPGNDANSQSIAYFASALAQTYKDAR
jgi:small subunit ribosomal protein S2